MNYTLWWGHCTLVGYDSQSQVLCGPSVCKDVKNINWWKSISYLTVNIIAVLDTSYCHYTQVYHFIPPPFPFSNSHRYSPHSAMRSHIMTVVSFDPDTTLVPSLVKARQLTADLWPLDAYKKCADFTLQCLQTIQHTASQCAHSALGEDILTLLKLCCY